MLDSFDAYILLKLFLYKNYFEVSDEHFKDIIKRHLPNLSVDASLLILLKQTMPIVVEPNFRLFAYNNKVWILKGLITCWKIKQN